MTDRTIIVDNAEEALADRLEWAHQKHEDAEDAVDKAYFSRYIQFMRGRIDELESGGLSEDTLLSTYQSAREDWEAIDEKTEDNVATAARTDVDLQILKEFFGYGAVELSDITDTASYQDGTVELKSLNGETVRVETRDEQQALEIADLFLDLAGHSLEELRNRAGREMI